TSRHQFVIPPCIGIGGSNVTLWVADIGAAPIEVPTHCTDKPPGREALARLQQSHRNPLLHKGTGSHCPCRAAADHDNASLVVHMSRKGPVVDVPALAGTSNALRHWWIGESTVFAELPRRVRSRWLDCPRAPRISLGRGPCCWRGRAPLCAQPISRY